MCKLPKLTICAILAVMIVAFGADWEVCADEVASTGLTGQERLQKAMQRLSKTPLTARVRQAGTLLGQSFVGSGLYGQMLDDEGELFTRLSMNCQFDELPGSYLQVRTGSFLWMQRRVGDEQYLSRVDVRRVLRELGRAGREGEGRGSEINRVGASLAGGMPGMLAALLEQYRFAPPRECLYREVAAYEFVGEPTADSLPPFAPNHVRLILGRDDDVLYSIVYDHTPDARDHVEPGELTTEFYEVAPGRSGDPLAYRFQWDGQEFSDATSIMVQRLRWVVQ